MPNRSNKTYTKQDIADELASRFRISRLDASKLVGFAVESIRLALEAGLRVELRRFGCFELKRRKPKVVRNPSRPEAGSFTLPPQTVVVFNACPNMARKIKPL